MNDETREALRASINHWLKNFHAEAPQDTSVSSTDCALCGLFYGDYSEVADTDCVGCPVYEKSGMPSCINTPYLDAHEARYRWFQDPGDDARREEWRSAAREMVMFLRGLYPKEDTA
jgi:hypothetical protein